MDESAHGDPSRKRPGKREWAGRRRPVTRRAGFHSHPEVTGGEYEVDGVGGWLLGKGASVTVEFRLPQTPEGTLLGFGGWYRAPDTASVDIDGLNEPEILTSPAAPDWSKFGSQWYSDGSRSPTILFRISATEDSSIVAIYSLGAGVARHKYYDQAESDPRNLMKNKHRIAPEGNFYSPEIHADISEPILNGPVEPLKMGGEIYLKGCNRCGRFLPINVHDERKHLSFSNHCTAAHRVPCSHPLFSRLRNRVNDETIQLKYGFQLECRFCKKFEVNAALNPLRTVSQHKEDAARRRAIEELLSELYGGSTSLLFREQTGRELTEDVLERFEHRCFKCGTQFPQARDMHLDHTRPLALLWPLDQTATALCATHNSEKRDRPPVEYYDDDELTRLAALTGISDNELRDPAPNREAIALLENRLEWFFDEFLQQPWLQEPRDGKVPADLLVKAVQKAMNRDPDGPRFDIEAMHEERLKR
ncbi:MAG: hypothetical protein WAO61_00260 [Solirubrobacterales bacterium]